MYQGKKVALVGYGVDMAGAYEFFQGQGASVTIHDQDAAKVLPDSAPSVLGPQYLDTLDQYDLVVRTPGLLPYNVKTIAPVTTAANEFMRHCPAPVIGVTGTKGKGTTASLIYHILDTASLRVFLGGNIGRGVFTFFQDVTARDWVVLELSNLQLWDATISPHVAVLLMIVPEHLDWHRGNIDEYVATKANITRFQGPKDLLVYHGTNQYTTTIAASSKADLLPYLPFGKVPAPSSQPPAPNPVWIDGTSIKIGNLTVAQTTDVTLIGTHNLENVAAAIGATWSILTQTLGVERAQAVLAEAIRTFKPLPHRLEFVAEVEGVTYYNDSIGTTPEATIAAIKAFVQPKILIMGGSDKGADFTEVARQIVAANVKAVVLMGDTTPKLQLALDTAGFPPQQIFIPGFDLEIVMQAALHEAKIQASSGDVVLLAPACASFGLFKNYQDRGDQFKTAVRDSRKQDNNR